MLRRIAAAVALLFAAATPGSAGERGPVVVELFTSQGCNSCPPADALLADLAKRKDVLPLSFHVDYWDYLGWKDPHASRANTERQRAYSRALTRRRSRSLTAAFAWAPVRRPRRPRSGSPISASRSPTTCRAARTPGDG